MLSQNKNQLKKGWLRSVLVLSLDAVFVTEKLCDSYKVNYLLLVWALNLYKIIFLNGGHVLVTDICYFVSFFSFKFNFQYIKIEASDLRNSNK